MIQYIIKISLTTLLIVVISELSKRNSIIGALLASLPLISVIAIIWLYFDTKDIARISDLSTQIFWLVIPSLVLFITLPIFLHKGISFYISLTFSILLTIASYLLMINILKAFNIKL